MKIHELSKSQKKAVAILKAGGIVIYPTDTVFGIGCRWDSMDAVTKISEIKKRPISLPFPLLISSVAQVKKIAIVTKSAQNLIERFWPGGLTIILKAKARPRKIGFRMPKDEVLLQVISQLGVPIIGTSANFHAKPSIKSSSGLDRELISLVDYVLEGECPGGVESTVVDATGDELKLIRQGAVVIDES